MNDLKTITAPAPQIEPKPSKPFFADGTFMEFSEMDCLAVYLGQEPGTPVSLEDISGLLHDNSMGHAIAAGRSELIERNRKKFVFGEDANRIGHDIMRDARAYWPNAAVEMTAEWMMSMWVTDDLEDFVKRASDEAKQKRRATLDAEVERTGKPLTVERAREFVARELELSMRETIRRTTGLKAAQVLALVA